MLEEAYLVQFLAELSLLFWRDVLERGAVGAKVQANKFHDALAANDVAAEVTDDVYNLLTVVLQSTCRLQIAAVPGLYDAHQILAVIVGGSSDSTLCSAHSQAG